MAINLTEYLNTAIENLVQNILNASITNRRESLFLIRFAMSVNKAKRVRNRHESNHEHIPPFLIASITTNCNLFCSGCYSRSNNCMNDSVEQNALSVKEWDGIFSQAKKLGVSFILLAGGEPLMKKDIIMRASKYKNMVFPIFTNGTLIDDEYIALFDKYRNLLPILSIEGNKKQTDGRRGEGTYDILTGVMNKLRSKGIYFGVSITVTTKNIKTVTSDSFINTLDDNGCKLVFYVEYVPVNSTGTDSEQTDKDLAPTDKERKILEESQAKLRNRFSNIVFISFPGDEKSTGGCLAAGRGFFHINADGSAEPCPFSPYSDMSLKTHTLSEALKSPLFRSLKSSGMLLGEHTGGCLLFEKEEEVKKLLVK